MTKCKITKQGQNFLTIDTDYAVIAKCEWRTYDVWGNDKDGWDVNNTFSQGEIELKATLSLHNIPILPLVDGSKPQILPIFSISDGEIKRVLDIKGGFTTDGDDILITINRKSDDKPLAEIRVLGYYVIMINHYHKQYKEVIT
jgi:hypothetical protein